MAQSRPYDNHLIINFFLFYSPEKKSQSSRKYTKLGKFLWMDTKMLMVEGRSPCGVIFLD